VLKQRITAAREGRVPRARASATVPTPEARTVRTKPCGTPPDAPPKKA